MKSFAWHEAWFERYAAKERALETEDPGPMDLKLAHTMHVVDNARHIVESEAFPPDIAHEALLAALYHDIARFEQYLRYRTFRDRVSVDHGRFGVRILKAEGCLADEPDDMRHCIMAAVALHNRFALPGHLPEKTALVTRIVRDADKLDILRVIHGHLSVRPYNPTVVLQLPDTDTLASSAVIEASLQNRVASYADLKTVNDFRLLLASWIFDMNFPSSRAAFVDQGHALAILEELPENHVYAKARAHMLGILTKDGEGALS